MKTKALIEKGEYNSSELTSLQIPLIAQKIGTLTVDLRKRLTFVGRIGEDGIFIHIDYRVMDNHRGLTSISKLSPRALILSDGRVFYDISKTRPEDPNELYPLDLFIGEQFGAYGNFEERFNKLYRDFLN